MRELELYAIIGPFSKTFFLSKNKQDTEGCINAETIFMLYKNINVEFIF